MPNIVSKYVDDYWFSTNIIDCCNTVELNNSQLLYIANKKLYQTQEKQHRPSKYLNERSGRNICTLTEHNATGANADQSRPVNKVFLNQQKHRDRPFEKKNKEYTFSRESTVDSGVLRNMYFMPPKSRWYYLDKMAVKQFIEKDTPTKKFIRSIDPHHRMPKVNPSKICNSRR